MISSFAASPCIFFSQKILIVLIFALMAQYGLHLVPAEGPLDVSLFIENFSQLSEILSGVFDYIRSKVVPE